MRETDRKAFGAEAEELAARHLQSRGFTIRDRNVPCRVGELDVVAERGDLIVIAEVRMKSSGAHGDPLETVMSAKQRRVVKAAHYYLWSQRLLDRVEVRFDVISVVGRGSSAAIEHVENAFDAGF